VIYIGIVVAMMKTAKKKRKRKKQKKNTLPTQVELFQGAPSPLTVSAFLRSGGGFHEDKKTKRKRTRQAKEMAALKEEVET
jgi:hypothetical protein